MPCQDEQIYAAAAAHADSFVRQSDGPERASFKYFTGITPIRRSPAFVLIQKFRFDEHEFGWYAIRSAYQHATERFPKNVTSFVVAHCAITIQADIAMNHVVSGWNRDAWILMAQMVWRDLYNSHLLVILVSIQRGVLTVLKTAHSQPAVVC